MQAKILTPEQAASVIKSISEKDYKQSSLNKNTLKFRDSLNRVITVTHTCWPNADPSFRGVDTIEIYLQTSEYSYRNEDYLSLDKFKAAYSI